NFLNSEKLINLYIFHIISFDVFLSVNTFLSYVQKHKYSTIILRSSVYLTRGAFPASPARFTGRF
ncbi:TPA: hypothetical protein ACHK6M_004067, partial [Escherichia coli]